MSNVIYYIYMTHDSFLEDIHNFYKSMRKRQSNRKNEQKI